MEDMFSHVFPLKKSRHLYPRRFCLAGNPRWRNLGDGTTSARFLARNLLWVS